MTQDEHRAGDGLERSEAESAPERALQEGEEAPPPGVRFMAIARWAIVFAMGVAATASLVSVFGAQRESDADAHRQPYYCPMHPSVVQDHPGDCPICNMTLVPRPEAPAPRTASAAADAQDGQTNLPAGLVPIELSPDRVQLIGMRTAHARRDTPPSTLSVVGAIAPTERAVSSVQTRFTGWVQELQVAETGQLVHRGQLLARIYSPELLSAQQELLNAKGWQRGDASAAPIFARAPEGSLRPSLLENARNRLILMGMEPGELAEVERTLQPHRSIELRSPAAGYVADKNALLGLLVQPGAELFRIVDLTVVWALIEVFERDAGRLRVGQEATVTLPSYPGEVFYGKVTFVYPVLSPETRTLRARVELKNAELKLKPGMFATVSLSVSKIAGNTQPLSIPRDALVDTGEHQYVFVQRSVGRFEPRAVQVGARGADTVQIVSGLSDDDIVVTTGNFLLDSESRLRAAIAGH